jgi:DNA-binding response OmpR family regulator
MGAPTRLVAVVEREDTLRESICRALGVEGFGAQGYADGAAAADAFTRPALPDLAILGVDVPSTGGLELCRLLREREPALPVIMVTEREEQLDEPAIVSSGADDHLPKPFSIKELMARVTVLLRRASLTGAETLAWEDRPLTLGPLTVDPLRLSAHWSGKPLHLTVTEFFILHALVRRAGIVKTRDQLLREAYPGRASAERIVENHIRRIRQKFETLDRAFDALEGVHGAGYRYRAGAGPRRP